jgi:CheY-like chemotaxis protein
MTIEALPSVLVVDDETENLDTFRRVFRKDFAMHFARSGSEALTLLRTQRFDVALVDYAMPEMNGLELLRHAITVQPTMARLMVTAHEGVAAVRQARTDGVTLAVIPKPWSREQILQAVATVLRLGRMRASVDQLSRVLKGLAARACAGFGARVTAEVAPTAPPAAGRPPRAKGAPRPRRLPRPAPWRRAGATCCRAPRARHAATTPTPTSCTHLPRGCEPDALSSRSPHGCEPDALSSRSPHGCEPDAAPRRLTVPARPCQT